MRPCPRRKRMYREPMYSRSLRQRAPAVGVRPGKRDRVSANTERLEQFSSIGRSPIVKPAGYARHLFLGRPRSLSLSLSRVSFQRNRIRLLLFPPESPPRFLRQGTFDTRPCFSLAALLRCNCTFFHPLRIAVRFARSSSFSSSPCTSPCHLLPRYFPIRPSFLSCYRLSSTRRDLNCSTNSLGDTAPLSTRIFEATPAMVLPDLSSR